MGCGRQPALESSNPLFQGHFHPTLSHASSQIVILSKDGIQLFRDVLDYEHEASPSGLGPE
jgi:hypothetical protein